MTQSPDSTRHFDSTEQIDNLVAEFKAGTWSFEKWTHGAHLMVALWHLTRYSVEEATPLIRSGIQSYNAAKGIPTTPTRGYHESITLFWIWAVSQYLSTADRSAPLHVLANDLLAGPRGDKNYPFEYYSRDHLMSWEARTTWVEPDLKALE